MFPTLNNQQKFWSGEFGDDYIKRNLEFHNVQYTDSDRLSITKSFFQDIPRDSSILEIGCNVGSIIWILDKMGFTDVTGIDIKKEAIDIISKRYPHYTFIHSSIESFQLRRKYDMVYTSAVLIHIHPDNLMRVVKKIKALSYKHIFGFEYYSEDFEEADYYKEDKMWTGDYPSLFDMKPERMELHDVKDSECTHCYYLL